MISPPFFARDGQDQSEDLSLKVLQKRVGGEVLGNEQLGPERTIVLVCDLRDSQSDVGGYGTVPIL